MPMKKKKSPVRANEARTTRVKKNDPSLPGGLKEQMGMPGFLRIGKNAGVLFNTTKTYLASILK